MRFPEMIKTANFELCNFFECKGINCKECCFGSVSNFNELKDIRLVDSSVGDNIKLFKKHIELKDELN